MIVIEYYVSLIDHHNPPEIAVNQRSHHSSALGVETQG